MQGLMNYTAVGNTVNVAKRLQENALGGQILISESIHSQAMNVINAPACSNLAVKGRVQSVMTFEISSN